MMERVANLPSKQLSQKYYKHIMPWDVVANLLRILDGPIVSLDTMLTTRMDTKIRNRSYRSFKEFVNFIIKTTPVQIDIGGFLPSFKMQEWRAKGPKDAFPTINLIKIDVDYKDYEGEFKGMPGIREYLPCNHDTKVEACPNCWKFILKPSLKILMFMLKRVFGLQNLLVSYSGKKGYHIRILDSICYTNHMDRESRSAFLKIINKGPGNEELWTELQDTILIPYFRQYITPEKDIIFPKECFAYAYKNVIGTSMPQKLSSFTSTKKFIRYMARHVDIPTKKKILSNVAMCIIWPRLDESVTESAGHLLKALFSIHPGTGNIAAPILDWETYDCQKDKLTLENVCRNPSIMAPHVDLARNMVAKTLGEQQREIIKPGKLSV